MRLVALIAVLGSVVAVAAGANRDPKPSTMEQFIPRKPDARPRRAAALMAQRQFSAAADILTAYLAERPGDGDARVQLGWCRYRAGRFQEAHAEFQVVLRATPRSDDARLGIAYSLLQLKGGEEAAREFREILSRDATNRDALEGMVLAGRRPGVSKRVMTDSLEAARRLEAMSKTFRPELLPSGSEQRRRGPLPSTDSLRVPARAIKDYLEVNEHGTWRPMFVRGFNLGAALPGRFASEFPTDESVYRGWLETIASLNANAIRVYTLLPPQFYRALKAHNDRASQRLWLIQGVWAELPPRHDFANADYLREFHAETARIIDAVHGNLILGPRAGHAFGVYDADASASVLAYIIGREWEPFAVADYNKLHAGQPAFKGVWFEATGGHPMENWVAGVCDFAAAYEARQYRVIRPLTFANWPTLDPLHHPTESTRDEENAWRTRYGLPFKQSTQVIWEDDAVTLDATLIRPTAAMQAGFFAAYHIYPNFPDFMNLDPQYQSARDGEGPSRYAGYLAALKAYHGTQPVLVAEFGMATSRGVAHLHPQGWHHGGVSEEEQGRIVARMFRSIRDARYAGGIVFELMDEWFKSTWSVSPYQSPSDRRQMWFDGESPEESYGILAARPNRASIVIDGDAADWNNVPILTER